METGKAYGFFSCDASKEEIERELPHIRYMAQTPSAMDIYLTEGRGTLNWDHGLITLAKEAEEAGRRYVMEATYSGASNRVTAQELTDILAQLFWSPSHHGEKFLAEIFYKEGERYILKDQEIQ